MSIVSVVALVGTIQAAPAGDWPPDLGRLRSGLPADAQFEAAMAVTGGSTVTITFFSTSRADGRPAWFARRETASEGGADVSWAAAADCPALYAALDWLTDIQPPAFAMNGLRRLPDDARPYSLRPMRGPVADGPTWWVAGRGWGPDRSLVDVTASTTGGYIADWGEATIRHLADCWVSEPPVSAGR